MKGDKAMDIQEGDKVYLGWETRASEVVRIHDFGMIELKKVTAGGHKYSEYIDDVTLLNHKSIYQRLADLEKGKVNG